MQKLLHPLVRGLSNVPLRVALIVPFVLQITAAVGLTAYFSLRDGQRAVNEVAAELRNEVTNRVHQHLANYLETPQLVTAINASAFRLGELNLQDGKRLEQHFWQQMQLFQSLSPIAFGSEQGEIHAVDRLQDGTLVIRVIDASTAGKYHTYTINQQGNRQQLIRLDTTFDPRIRPWYREAVQANKPTWTAVYPYFSSRGLAVSATRPIYDEAGTLIGATNATVSLSQLDDFLHRLKVGRSGQTFIIERSGNLVASSTAELPFSLNLEGVADPRRRLSAIASRNQMTRLTAQQLQQYFGSFSSIRQSQQLNFVVEGQRQFVQVMPFTDGYGLDWLIVVVVPEADFMEHIEASRRTTVLLCLGALLVAIVLGVLTSHRITDPILRLCSASQALANGNFNQTVSLGGVNEFRVLAQAHNQMAAQLRGSFTALEAVKDELELRVTQRTAELQERTLQLGQALDLEALLKRVTDKVRDSLDEAQILETVVQELNQALIAECCNAALYDLEKNVITIHYEAVKPGWPSSQSGALPLETVSDVHQALLEGQILQFCRLAPKFSRPQAAILACPIFDDQGVLGDLWIFRLPNCVFDDLEVRLVQQAANQCAIAIRQARLYQAAQAQVEVLQHLHQLKDDFLSTVSHELRTPISNMKLALHMLKLSPSSERQQQYLEILQAECAREANLINDLLDLQRLEADRYPISLETIVLQDWLTSIVQPFSTRMQERGQQFTVDLPPHVLPIQSDRNSLARLLAELLNNACKYTPPQGEIQLRVEQQIDPALPDQPAALRTQFEVSNQAEIPPAALPHIFEKFYRVPHADPWRQGGTGLGLALVQKLVAQIGGELRVDSGQGWTTFEVLLEGHENSDSSQLR
ncbi:cache domain-containing protein [Trichocoleus sp. FACHB-262]|uniref:sensor histidine kinase n=1 Tax=Trichocoleus sp. FACHB-262 TaxID=2692869 RepID=UPI001682BC59|nr:cache domain-containing protein [Trichocoleus sp. FACHB-262]MBD2120906.1 GAF domain-containing protein [Trichocoleus sp. FACHB-262]